MATPSPAESDDLIPLLRSGQAPLELRRFAAAGLLPLAPEDQIRALLAVIEDPDPETAQAARRTFDGTPPDELSQLLSGGTTPRELDTISCLSEDPFVLEQVIRHKDVGDPTLEALARRVSGAPQEALVVNQVRLLRKPALIDALFENPQLTPDVRRRLNEIREEFFEKQKRRRQAREEEEARLAEEQASEEESSTAEPAADSEGAEGAIDSSLTTGAVYRRIATMTVSEKIKLAYSGGKEERAILIGDSNRLVGLAVLKSRGLTVNEVESYCSMRHLDIDIFRKIAEDREWIRKPPIVLALVKNPKVPIAITLPLVKHLQVRELRTIIRDPNMRDGLRISARKFLVEKRR